MNGAIAALLLASALAHASAGAQAPKPERMPAAPPAASAATASEPTIFRGADLQLGRQLIEQHRCSACHANKFGGDGSAIYRPKGRINTPGLLRGMTEQCNTELNLGLFPEEVTAVAAVLNRAHYRFSD